MTHMKTLIGAVALGLSSLAAGGGCTGIASSMPGIQNATGEAWFTETTGLGFLNFSTRVYYCPPPAGSAPAQCMEAQMVEPSSSAPPSERPKKAAKKKAAPTKEPTEAPEEDER